MVDPQTLTIGETAQRAGVTVATLRYYEQRGLLAANRTTGNQRRYPRHVLRRHAPSRPGTDPSGLDPPQRTVAKAGRRPHPRASSPARHPGRLPGLRLPVLDPVQAVQPER